jgi:phage protein U
MTKFILAVLPVLFLCQISFCQKILVKTTDQTVSGQTYTGQAVQVELERKSVERAWVKQLKELGRVDQNKNQIEIKNVILPEIQGEVRILSLLNTTLEGTQIFWVILHGNEAIKAGTTEFSAASKFLYDFVLSLYRDDVNKQIADADKTVEESVERHDRKVKESLEIARNLQRNRSDRIRFQKQLEENGINFQRLKGDSIQAELDKTETIKEIDKLRKISEEKKNKLKEFN